MKTTLSLSNTFHKFVCLQANELMECITQRQSGFHFLGKDYYEIIKYLGLKKFTISISRNRKDIIENQKEASKLKTKKSLAKLFLVFNLLASF